MKVFTVDLYKEFNIDRPEGAKGYLTCYLKETCDSIGNSRLFPSILVIAGGAYTNVSKRETEPVALKFIAENYNAFVLEYSCAPFKFPTAFIEASMATCYIRKNALSLSVNENCLATIGFSAGGHLNGCLSNLFDSPILDFLGQDKVLVKPNASLYLYPVVTAYEEKGSHVSSFEMLCGDNEELKEQLSIENCVTKNSPPAFIAGTCEDSCVPVSNALLLASAYQKNGVPFALHIFEKGPHGGSVGTKAVYSEQDYPVMQKRFSTDFKLWPSLALNWLKDLGFECKN